MKLAGGFLLVLISLGALVAVQAPTQVDCQAYANHAGPEPPGYAAQCLGITPPVATLMPSLPAARLPTDTAVAHDVGFVSDNFVNHSVGDLSAQAIVGTSADQIFAYDFDREGELLYAIRNTDAAFGVSIDGTFASIGTLTPVPEHGAGANWSGLAVDPVDGTFYATSLGTTTALYTIDPTTATATPLFQVESHTLVIDIAVNCKGEIYAHDIGTDTLLRFDIPSQTLQTVGPTGVDSNFAQGMDFDNSDGKLYMYTYQGGGANVYGTANLTTGALTPINTSDPQGEFEGAIPTKCPLLDFFIGD